MKLSYYSVTGRDDRCDLGFFQIIIEAKSETNAKAKSKRALRVMGKGRLIPLIGGVAQLTKHPNTDILFHNIE